jgi:hypothetical protein
VKLKNSFKCINNKREILIDLAKGKTQLFLYSLWSHQGLLLLGCWMFDNHLPFLSSFSEETLVLNVGFRAAPHHI